MMSKMERTVKYVKIAERAEKIGYTVPRWSLLMDLESADLKFHLRLDDWLNADDFNFTHDLNGIIKNIDKSRYPATDFGTFVPRFAGSETES